MLKVKECNLCGTGDWSMLYKFKGYNVAQCKKCGFLFRDVRLTKEETEELYSSKYFLIEQKDYFSQSLSMDEKDSRVLDFSNKIKKIEELRGAEKGKILDVGCAMGMFLEIARKRGWEVFGVEISEYAGGYARKQFGLNVCCKELPEANFPDNYFDIITMWDTIDHSEHPSELLFEVNRILKDNGLLVLATTVEDSLLYRIVLLV